MSLCLNLQPGPNDDEQVLGTSSVKHSSDLGYLALDVVHALGRELCG